MTALTHLEELSKLIRYDILTATTTAGSGHPSSSLSAVELTVPLFFGGVLHFDFNAPSYPGNDRFVLSKGHAAPLLYALYHAGGIISEAELLSLRKFASIFEGHPTPRIPYVDAATGSLGQGLSVGVGMALGLKLKFQAAYSQSGFATAPRVYVLLGDSELAEGQIWEAAELGAHYKLDNLIAVIDVNRLGQRGETMLGWDLETYARRFAAFGWEPVIIPDGHNLEAVSQAYHKALSLQGKPIALIAKTLKGKGVSFMENQDGWHGKPVPANQLQAALNELGSVDLKLRGEIAKPLERSMPEPEMPGSPPDPLVLPYSPGQSVATREAYGDALLALGKSHPAIVALDAEVSNSTYSEKFKKAFPQRFFEMFVAEQNMASAALGISKIGFTAFVSSFAAFLTRTYDQLRIAQYSNPNVKLCGSHAGVSIGADGPSQMALEDLAMARSLLASVVFYPSDAVSTAKLTRIMAETQGLFYLRTTREKTPVLYSWDEPFNIGGFKVLRQSDHDAATVIAAGITVFEALKAYDRLVTEGISFGVVDLYGLKPLDAEGIKALAAKTGKVIVVEDHYPAGGMGEAIQAAVASLGIAIRHLCVHRVPRSGTPEELLAYEEIDAAAIMRAVKA